MAKRMLRVSSGLGMALLLCAGQYAQAHHSFGMFDMHQNVTIDGTVKDYQWTNPHVWIDLMREDPATHQAVLWPVECDSVAIMTNKGWARDTLKPGDKVSLVIHPLRKGDKGGSLVSASVNGTPIGHSMVFPDGSKGADAGKPQ